MTEKIQQVRVEIEPMLHSIFFVHSTQCSVLYELRSWHVFVFYADANAPSACLAGKNTLVKLSLLSDWLISTIRYSSDISILGWSVGMIMFDRIKTAFQWLKSCCATYRSSTSESTEEYGLLVVRATSNRFPKSTRSLIDEGTLYKDRGDDSSKLIQSHTTIPAS